MQEWDLLRDEVQERESREPTHRSAVGRNAATRPRWLWDGSSTRSQSGRGL